MFIETDSKAARLCGRVVWSSDGKVYTRTVGDSKGLTTFTLSNKHDLLATVIALGDKHNVVIYPVYTDDDRLLGWSWCKNSSKENGCIGSYIETVASAVESI